MLQPTKEQREMIKSVWMDGKSPFVQYLVASMQKSMETVLDTEGKARDEATGEVKCCQSLLAIMSGRDEAHAIVRRDG